MLQYDSWCQTQTAELTGGNWHRHGFQTAKHLASCTVPAIVKAPGNAIRANPQRAALAEIWISRSRLGRRSTRQHPPALSAQYHRLKLRRHETSRYCCCLTLVIAYHLLKDKHPSREPGATPDPQDRARLSTLTRRLERLGFKVSFGINYPDGFVASTVFSAGGQASTVSPAVSHREETDSFLKRSLLRITRLLPITSTDCLAIARSQHSTLPQTKSK